MGSSSVLFYGSRIEIGEDTELALVEREDSKGPGPLGSWAEMNGIVFLGRNWRFVYGW